MSRVKVGLILLAFAAGVGAATPTLARTVGFLQLTNEGGSAVAGSAQEQPHKGWIPLNVVGTPGSATPANVVVTRLGKVSAPERRGELTVTKPVDSSSPALSRALASGRHFSEAVIDFPRSREGREPSGGRWTLQDVMIASIHPAGAEGKTRLEQVTLSYTKITR